MNGLSCALPCEIAVRRIIRQELAAAERSAITAAWRLRFDGTATTPRREREHCPFLLAYTQLALSIAYGD
jgi:hypothetical protein